MGPEYIELEVEVVRTETILVRVTDGHRQSTTLREVDGADALRTVTYWTHSAKDLAKGEKVRLVSQRWIPGDRHDRNCEKERSQGPDVWEKSGCCCADRLYARCVNPT